MTLRKSDIEEILKNLKITVPVKKERINNADDIIVKTAHYLIKDNLPNGAPSLDYIKKLIYDQLDGDDVTTDFLNNQTFTNKLIQISRNSQNNGYLAKEAYIKKKIDDKLRAYLLNILENERVTKFGANEYEPGASIHADSFKNEKLINFLKDAGLSTDDHDEIINALYTAYRYDPPVEEMKGFNKKPTNIPEGSPKEPKEPFHEESPKNSIDREKLLASGKLHREDLTPTELERLQSQTQRDFDEKLRNQNLRYILPAMVERREKVIAHRLNPELLKGAFAI